jgi:putative Mg2+ transporter-C (MgtC) family protein
MSGLTDINSWVIFNSDPELLVNIKLLIKILGALCLGVLIGYERFYHGHAAGMRTYGLVCMASSGLVALSGYPEAWFGGQTALVNTADPTRIIQGIVTGIGFLGAGVIVHEQYSTRGLTSAASIWASSVIGIMVGIGFYPAAIFLTMLSTLCMILVKKIENNLPSNEEIAVILEFPKGGAPSADKLQQLVRGKGYIIANRSLSVINKDRKIEWHFILVAVDRTVDEPITVLSDQLATIEGIVGFQLAHARN